MSQKEKITDILTRGVTEIAVRKELEKKLASGQKLRVKHGVDPTTDTLHLGYSAIYLKLRDLQALGHTVVFLIGTFTARFGDPTDKAEQRSMRDKSQVEAAAKTYVDQIRHILDFDRIEIRSNSEWYDQMNAEELLRLMSRFTVSRMLERDMFQERLKKNREVGLHEPVYPVLQGYDSVMLKSDLTVVGSDQLFNELQGRRLQSDFGQRPQDVLAMELLPGTDGKRKMSQSLKNDIPMLGDPNDQYGKLMSIPDALLQQYLILLTRIPMTEVRTMLADMKRGKANPRDVKMRLAREVVTIHHGTEEAGRAEAEFVNVFQKRKRPMEAPMYRMKKKTISIVEALVETKLASSRSDATRLITHGGVRLDGETTTDPKATISVGKGGALLQKGKHTFVRLMNHES